MKMAANSVARVLVLACSAGLGGLLGIPAGRAEPEPPPGLLDRLISLEEAPNSLCPQPDRGPAVAASMADRISELRQRIQGVRGDETIRTINQFVFEDLGLRPSRDLHDPRNLCLSAVLSRRQGYCVGIAGVYLVLAEGVGVPIHAVSAPSHLFLRYDDGRRRINIETFRQGAEVSDADYARDERIPQASIDAGVFLRSLTADEFLGQVYNNLGVIHWERNEPSAAVKAYEQALDLDPRLAAAWYNWGNDLLRSGDYRQAARMLTRSLDLYPTDVWALNNRGVAYSKLGKDRKARRDFNAALALEPDFKEARDNLSKRSDR
jgi:regulator of sirC expression with transglutaminase-like and TPR domain